MGELPICPECMKVRAHTRSLPPYKCPRCTRIATIEAENQELKMTNEKKRPTVVELETILADAGDREIRLQSDGSVISVEAETETSERSQDSFESQIKALEAENQELKRDAETSALTASKMAEVIAGLERQLSTSQGILKLQTNRVENQKRQFASANTKLAVAREGHRHLTEQYEARGSALAEAKADKDTAYNERDRLVAWLAVLFPSLMGRHSDADDTWEDDWRWIVYIEHPDVGQLSWHIHDSELHLFDHVTREVANYVWDGHTTEEKYQRVSKAIDAAKREGR